MPFPASAQSSPITEGNKDASEETLAEATSPAAENAPLQEQIGDAAQDGLLGDQAPDEDFELSHDLIPSMDGDNSGEQPDDVADLHPDGGGDGGDWQDVPELQSEPLPQVAQEEPDPAAISQVPQDGLGLYAGSYDAEDLPGVSIRP